MATAPGPEGIVFGAGDHLPDASALADFSRLGQTQLSLTTWALRNHPDTILRLQRDALNNEAAYWQLARNGITHLKELQNLGVPIPPQRFVVGPDPDAPRSRKRLYAMSDRLAGRDLTHDEADASYAQTVIGANATYVLRRAAGDSPSASNDQFLFDTGYAWQHTVLDHPQPTGEHFVLRDAGLEFANLENIATQGTMRFIAVYLLRWTRQAAIEPPKDLRKLLSIVETPEQRAKRETREKNNPALRFPDPPPPNWIGKP